MASTILNFREFLVKETLDKQMRARDRDSCRLLVFGFIRKYQKSNDNGDLYIGDDLIQLMAEWISFEDMIDITKTSKQVKVTDVFANGERQRLSRDDSFTLSNHSFLALGSNVVSRGQTEVWVFKVIKHFGIVIGIVNTKHTEMSNAEIEDFDFTNNEYNGYGYFTLDGMIYHNESGGLDQLFRVSAGQYFEMILDLSRLSAQYTDRGKLTFSVYGEDKKLIDSRVAFDNIDTANSYKLALTFYGGDCIALMESDCLNSKSESSQKSVVKKSFLKFD